MQFPSSLCTVDQEAATFDDWSAVQSESTSGNARVTSQQRAR